MATVMAGSEAAEPDQPGALIVVPLRPLFVLALAVAPFGFFANPPGWVWALMLAPDGVRLCRPPSRSGGRGWSG
jgi:hypothetical protein